MNSAQKNKNFRTWPLLETSEKKTWLCAGIYPVHYTLSTRSKSQKMPQVF